MDMGVQYIMCVSLSLGTTDTESPNTEPQHVRHDVLKPSLFISQSVQAHAALKWAQPG